MALGIYFGNCLAILIIDVDPEEAQLLIGLIEFLIEDWYITRHKRQSAVICSFE
jgi:hypothetical protein